MQADGVSQRLLNFDTSGVTTNTKLPITIAGMYPGEYVALILQWDEPFLSGAPGSPGAANAIDICITDIPANAPDQITDINGNPLPTFCSGPNTLGHDPVQILYIGNPAATGTPPTQSAITAKESVSIQIGLVSGSAPKRIKLAVEDDGAGSTINKFANNGPTLQGHPGAAGAAAVGAAWYFMTPRCGTTATLEAYSSAGGDPILFGITGIRLPVPTVRQKPDFVAPDGPNDTFLGSATGPLTTQIAQCQSAGSNPNFFGTSAATPHAGGIAALMLQANPALKPMQIYAALRTTAGAMGAVPNFDAGYGFIDARKALAALPPGPPTLTLTPASITVGSSATLQWSSINAASCSASDSWIGNKATSGSFTAAPGAPGSYTYSLACTNANGTSTVASAKLAVLAPVDSGVGGGGGGGGGGAIDDVLLALLAARALIRRPRSDLASL
jgi:hypothetical protein